MKSKLVLLTVISMVAFTVNPIMSAAYDEVKLTFSSPFPKAIPLGIGVDAAEKYIEEKSGGKVQVEIYYDGNLLSFNDTYAGVTQGIADMGHVGPANIDSNTLLNRVFSTFLKTTPPDGYKTSKAYQELIATQPSLNKEMEEDGLHWLSVMALPPCNLHTTNKVVKTIDDVKGIKLETLGSAVDYWTSLGASATSLDPGDYYMSLERGMVEGQYGHFASAQIFKTIELTKHHLIFGNGDGGLSTGVMGYIINADRWHSLSADTQALLIEAFNLAADENIRTDTPPISMAKKTAMEAADHTYIQITTAAELKPWIDAMEPVNEKWIKQCEDKGYPARQVYDALMQLLEKHR